MALSADFLTVNGIENIVDEGKTAMGLLDGMDSKNQHLLVDQKLHDIIDLMQQIIDNLQTEINQFLQKLGYPAGESGKKEFQAAVEEFYADQDISHFVGPDLLKIIQGYEWQSDQNHKDLITLLRFYFNNKLRDQSHNLVEEIAEGVQWNPIISVTGDEVARMLLGNVGDEGIGINVGRKGSSKLTSQKFVSQNPESNIIKVCIDQFTPEATKVLQNFLKELNEGRFIDTHFLPINDGNFSQEQLIDALKKNKAKGKIKSDDKLIQIGIDLAYYSKSSKESEVKDEKERAKRNEKIIHMLAPHFGQYSSAAKKVMNYMANDPLYGHSGMFLVGKSTTQIIGILGEITAILALYKLGKGKISLYECIWAGEEKNKAKKKLSIDIVLRRYGVPIGIQVKNTSKNVNEDLIEIGFANGKLITNKRTGIFDRLGITEVLGYDDSTGAPIARAEALERVLESNQFNVPFKRADFSIPYTFRETMYVTDLSHDENNAKTFYHYIELEKEIGALTNRIYTFLYQFTPDFLYMSYGKKGLISKLAILESDTKKALQDLRGNAVYMVGNRVCFADDMLRQFQQDLKNLAGVSLYNMQRSEEMSLQFRVNFYKGKNSAKSQNIVDYYNNGHFNDNTTLASYTTKLKSSWRFNK